MSAVSRLINISSRTLVQTGGGIAIAGFVIEGPDGVNKQVLIRGLGPALAQFGVTGFLTQPSIALYKASVEVASNTGWGTNADPAQVAAVTAQIGAFALPGGSADCALIADVTPGRLLGPALRRRLDDGRRPDRGVRDGHVEPGRCWPTSRRARRSGPAATS